LKFADAVALGDEFDRGEFADGFPVVRRMFCFSGIVTVLGKSAPQVFASDNGLLLRNVVPSP
jgi:hypothetical protein